MLWGAAGHWSQFQHSTSKRLDTPSHQIAILQSQHTCRQTTIHTQIHTNRQFRVSSLCNMHVFGLWDEIRAPKASNFHPTVQATGWRKPTQAGGQHADSKKKDMKPRTSLLWGDAANHWTTMLTHYQVYTLCLCCHDAVLEVIMQDQEEFCTKSKQSEVFTTDINFHHLWLQMWKLRKKLRKKQFLRILTFYFPFYKFC